MCIKVWIGSWFKIKNIIAYQWGVQRGGNPAIPIPFSLSIDFDSTSNEEINVRYWETY